MEDITEIYNVLESYKKALDIILDRLDQMDKMYEDYRNQTDERIHDLTSTLYDDLLNPAKQAMEDARKEDEFNEFKDRHYERFAEIEPQIKAIEGEDFDVLRKTFDDFGADNKGYTEDEYVENVYASVVEQINKVKNALGAEEIEVKTDEDGTEIKADGEEVTPEEIEEKIEDTENAETEEETEETEETEELEEDSPEEIEQLMKELEAYRG